MLQSIKIKTFDKIEPGAYWGLFKGPDGLQVEMVLVESNRYLPPTITVPRFEALLLQVPVGDGILTPLGWAYHKWILKAIAKIQPPSSMDMIQLTELP